MLRLVSKRGMEMRARDRDILGMRGKEEECAGCQVGEKWMWLRVVCVQMQMRMQMRPPKDRGHQ